MKQFISSLILISLCASAFGQGVGIGTENPDPSASLEVSSVTQGMLVPRMTSAQRDMIASPAQGLLVFDLTTNSFWFRNSSSWVQLVDSVSMEVKRSGPDQIYMGMTDKVGVGTSDPSYKLHVRTSDDEYGISHATDEVDIATYASNAIGGWMGTRSDHSFNLYAGDGFNQFTLLPNGNIGLGTTMPYYKMHLVGSSLFDGNVGIGTGPANKLDISHGFPRLDIHPNNRPLYVTGDLGSASDGIEFRHGNGTQGIGFGYNTIYAAGSNVNQDLGLSAKGATGNLVMSTTATERMRITGSGRVGIGTGSPLHKLHVAGKTYISDSLGIGSASIGFPLNFATTTGDKISLYGTNGNHFGLGIGPALLQIHSDLPGSDIAFGHGSSTSLTEVMRIKGTGNVGIATNNPLQKLHVSGKAYITDQLGIGVSSPNAPLQFANTTNNRKVVLYSDFNDDHQFFGFGVNPSILRYQVSTSGSDHVFYAGLAPTISRELMRIKGNGKVGINTLPANQLDIHSSVNSRYGTHPDNLPLYVTGDLGAESGIEFRHLSGLWGIGFGYNTIYATGSNAYQDLGLAARGNGSLLMKTNGTERMLINGSGNVGINTTSPEQLFSVADNAFTIDENGTMRSSANTMLYFLEDSVAYKMLLSRSPSMQGWGLSFLATTNTFVFQRNPGKVMDINLNSNYVEVFGTLKVGHTVVASAPVVVNALTTGAAVCNCPAGTVVTGGGYNTNGLASTVYKNFPESSTSWRVELYNSDIGPAITFYSYAICARFAN